MSGTRRAERAIAARRRVLPVAARTPVVMFALFSTTFANNSLSPLYVIYEERLRFDALVVTALSATYAVGVLVTLLLFGGLSDRIGRRPVLIFGSLAVLCSTLLFVVANGVGALFCGRAILGVATGMLTGAGAAALVELDTGHDRNLAARRTTLSLLGGTAVGPLAAGVVAQLLPGPTRSIFLIEVVIEVAGLVGMCFLPESSQSPPQRFSFAPQRPSIPVSIRAPFLVAAGVVATGWMLGGIYAALSGSMDRQLLHVKSHATAGLVLFVFAAAGGVAQQLARTERTKTTMATGIGAATLGMLMMVAALVDASAPLFVCATVLAGVGNGLCFAGSLALCIQIAPRSQRAEVVAAYSVVMYGTLVVPVVGMGLLADGIGLEHATVVYAVVLLVMVVGIAIGLYKTATTTPASVFE